MPISPAAIAALCDDLGRWRDRIQSVIGNDSLNWQSFGSEVFDDADGLLARLRMVENAGPLADAIDKELSDGWHLVTMNIGGNAWKVTDDGKRSVISDLELSREFGENVKRRVAYALAAVEQLRPDTPPNANPTSPQPTTGAEGDDRHKKLAELEQLVGQLGSVARAVLLAMCRNGINNVAQKRTGEGIAKLPKAGLQYNTPMKEALSLLQQVPYHFVECPGRGYFLTQRGCEAAEQLDSKATANKKSGQSRR